MLTFINYPFLFFIYWGGGLRTNNVDFKLRANGVDLS